MKSTRVWLDWTSSIWSRAVKQSFLVILVAIVSIPFWFFKCVLHLMNILYHKSFDLSIPNLNFFSCPWGEVHLPLEHLHCITLCGDCQALIFSADNFFQSRDFLGKLFQLFLFLTEGNFPLSHAVAQILFIGFRIELVIIPLTGNCFHVAVFDVDPTCRLGNHFLNRLRQSLEIVQLHDTFIVSIQNVFRAIARINFFFKSLSLDDGDNVMIFKSAEQCHTLGAVSVVFLGSKGVSAKEFLHAANSFGEVSGIGKVNSSHGIQFLS